MRKPVVFMGIDPGKSGAACIIDKRGRKIHDWLQWPKSDNYHLVADTILDWKGRYRIELCIMEKVASMHGQGVKSVFSFGKNYGAWNMLLCALAIPHQLLAPKSWQKGLLTNTDGPDAKSRVENVCCRIFPEARKILYGPRGGYHDGIGDALLMAYKARMLKE